MTSSRRSHPVFAFFLFHSSVGIRLAIRSLVPVVAVIFASFFILRYDFFLILAQALFVENSFLVTAVFFSLVSLGTARIAAPRVCHALDGWIRHLPASSLAQRRMASFAILLAQTPVLLMLGFSALALSMNLEKTPAVYLVGLPFLGVASSLFVTPVERRVIPKLLAAGACVLSASGIWLFVLSGGVLIVLSDLFSGGLAPSRERKLLRTRAGGFLLPFIISWRAVKLRIILPYLLSLPATGAAILFLVNNEPAPALQGAVVRSAGGLTISLFCGLLANMLAIRRPPWPWSRSLPLSARQRILDDALFLLLHSLPLVIVVGIVDTSAVIPLALSTPLLTVYASQAMRQTTEHRMGAAGKILMFGILGAFLIALVPWVSAAFLVMTPFALHSAERAERSQKVSRWLEIHHLAAGDSLSWRK